MEENRHLAGGSGENEYNLYHTIKRMHEEYTCVTALASGDWVISGFHACILSDQMHPLLQIHNHGHFQSKMVKGNPSLVAHVYMWSNIHIECPSWKKQANYFPGLVQIVLHIFVKVLANWVVGRFKAHRSLAASRTRLLSDMLCSPPLPGVQLANMSDASSGPVSIST